jgi:hypothetical protein
VAPNPILDKPEKRPAIKRPDPRRQSSDDLTALMASDAAESRARATLKLLQDEQAAREEAETARADLVRRNAALEKELEQQLKKVAAAPVTPADSKSMRPGMIRVTGKDWKIAVPLTLVLAIGAPAWAGIKHIMAAEQELRDLNKAVAGFQKREEEQDKKFTDLAKEITDNKNTMARISGYLAGVLPMAGVSVPGAEEGAIQVDIKRDRDPAGMARRPKVVTHTRIPAPAPDN